MEDILELISGIVGYLIYGTEEKSRHPIWRYSLRFIVFSGALLAVLILSGFLKDIAVPAIIFVAWLFCFVTLMNGEYYWGSKKVGVFALVILSGLSVWVLIKFL